MTAGYGENMQKISAKTGLNIIQPYDPEYKPVIDDHAEANGKAVSKLGATNNLKQDALNDR